MNTARFDFEHDDYRYYGWAKYVYSPGEKPDRISPGESESTEIGDIDLVTVHEMQTIEIDGKKETLQFQVMPGDNGHDYYVEQMRDSDTIMDRLRVICLESYHEERGS